METPWYQDEKYQVKEIGITRNGGTNILFYKDGIYAITYFKYGCRSTYFIKDGKIVCDEKGII
jgi:hypothetical protein